MPELNDPEIYQSVLDSLETGESAFGTKARKKLRDICAKMSSGAFCATTC